MNSNESKSQDRLAELLALAIDLEPVLFDKVLESAAIDELTGAYNHSFFRSGLANELNRAKALRYPLGLLLVSTFPPVELPEEIRQLTKDKALKSAAAELVVISRTTDWTSRSDENELALILPGCPASRLEELIGQLSERINPLEVRLTNGDVHSVALKFGAVCYLNGITDVDHMTDAARSSLDMESNPSNKVIVINQSQLQRRLGAA